MVGVSSSSNATPSLALHEAFVQPSEGSISPVSKIDSGYSNSVTSTTATAADTLMPKQLEDQGYPGEINFTEPSDTAHSLEERVRELETKLAVLSRLLQAHNLQPKQSFQQPASLDSPQPQKDPPKVDTEPLNRVTTPVSNRHAYRRPRSDSTPYLESPSATRKSKTPTFLEAKTLYSSDEDTTEVGNTAEDESRHLAPQNKEDDESNKTILSLERLLQPPGSEKFARMRGISMDETVSVDNRQKKTSSESLHDQGDEVKDSTSSPIGSTNVSEILRPKTHNRRNLSFRLLYSSDEEEYSKRNSNVESSNSLTLSERLWLGPSILQFQRQQQTADDVNELNQHKTPRRLSYPRLPPLRAPDESVRTKWLDHLNSYQESTADVDVQMEEFIKVPGGVEQVMSFGFCICLDSFLYMITILPIRFVWSVLLLLLNGFDMLRRNTRPMGDKYSLHRHHLYPVIQITILYTIYRYVLLENTIGKLYHWIRGQAMLKIYVLIAMVEVFDRLFSSLGQDCLESMYWNTVNRPRSSRMVISVMVVWLYASVHSLLLFLHVVTLHVAMNSTDHVLLTLLISGNFAEIKSTVFKKYNKAALFKITASDICERFKLALFLSLVFLLNACQGMEAGQFMGYVRLWGIVVGSEVLSDWIKHAFITKFNFLPSRVYPEYALLLAGDVTGIGHEHVNLDHSHAVVKRIGFAQIPLVSVLFRLLRDASKYYVEDLEEMPIWATFVVLAFWLCLVATKLALGNFLRRSSLAKLLAAPEYSQQSKHKKQ
ncbi:hypothetical protein FisN_16Lh170 [Fistulifera solaris]|uniref:Transmembrane anterior posterior transformation protein 1 n=1 Tax=Fistulifera solaris TaxID=1519565 RepID=A0A1Z5KJW2_FISSO|nr:hypothetical protein FisN_16Lh170 [Fistulifera solaris]|eukprot:GAX26331.1 hypothetical protein FisN_16Lh170 [Fistulifera solaris]